MCRNCYSYQNLLWSETYHRILIQIEHFVKDESSSDISYKLLVLKLEFSLRQDKWAQVFIIISFLSWGRGGREMETPPKLEKMGLFNNP